MKKFTLFTAVLFVSQLVFGQSFFVPTNYRGAFAPAPTAQWTDTWTNFDPQNTTYPTQTVAVSQSITNNTTWTANNTYLLQGQIYVKNGATLTIQPGTVILGDKATIGSGLFITQGSKLIAAGTVSNPIVFTSNQAPGQRAIGDWGGVILMGRATTNSAGGIANIEGIAPIAETQFGGGTNPDDNDNSGVLTYVRIEFGGYVYQTNKEINGLTLGAVGRGTKIDNVQVSFSNDDAFEWFGGTVNCRHLVSYRNLDDDFDTDNGYSGSVQFCLAVRDPNIADVPAVSTSEGFESDNDPTGSAATPQTSAVFSNVTYVGPLRGNPAASVAPGFKRGARLRRNTALKIYNSLFLDALTGVYIDATVATTEANAFNGVLKFKNNLVAGYQPNKSIEKTSTSAYTMAQWRTWFESNNNDSSSVAVNILTNPYGTNFLNPDFRPFSVSAATYNSSFTDNGISAKIIPAPTTVVGISYCVGETASALTASGNSDCTIKWYANENDVTSIPTPTPSTSVAGTTNYYVAQQTADGYEGPRVLVTVEIKSLPTVPAISANGSTSFCTGGSVVLTSSSLTGNVWSTEDDTQSITVTTSGSYTVTVDSNGCAATSAPTVVNVSASPTPTVNASATQACSGETVTLTASTADSYLWSNSATTQSIQVTATGNFTVTTTNSNACNGVGTSTPTAITITPTPTAAGSFTVNGNVVTFSNSSNGATTYSWDFDDFTNSSASAPVHAFAGNGDYTVVLTAINGNCTDTATFNVSITVGMNEIEGLEDVKVYPNPASELVMISFNNQNNTEVSIELIDQMGRLIETSTVVNNGLQVASFNVTSVQNGLYTIRILNNGNSLTRKVIVSK